MSINLEGANRTEITIAGKVFTVPAPFVEGHVLRSNEAAVLNQTYAENLRNNFASKVKEAGENLDVAALQSQLDEYVTSYDFGVRKGGGAVVVDPVEREARKLALGKVKEALKKKGHNAKDFSKEKLDELTTMALDKYPALREQARRIVALKQEIGGDTLDI